MKSKRARSPELIRLWTLVVLRVLVLLACFAALAWVLYQLTAVLLLVVLSIFFCYLIAPLVRAFEQPVYLFGREWKLPRGAAIVSVYVVVAGLLWVALQVLIPILWQQVTELASNLPNYVASASAGLRQRFSDANGWVRLPHEWREYLLVQLGHTADSFFPWLQSVVLGALGYLKFLPWLVVVPVLSFFMLKDAGEFERALVELMPARLQKRAHWLLRDVSRTMAGYIRAQIIACLVIGGLVTIGFALLGVPYAVVLGLISGVLEFVPMVGPLLAGIISFTLTLTVSAEKALWVAVFLIVLRIVQDYIIYPRIVQQGIKLHPMLVVLAILAGAEIGGLSGIFLAIPIVGLVIVTYKHYLAYRGLRELSEASAGAGGGTPDPAYREAAAGAALERDRARAEGK